MSGDRVGEGGGSEFQRVSDLLHARIADGTYPINHLLPPQRQLADELKVSRDTVQRVLRELASEGLVTSRQGSGSRVVRTQTARSSAATGSRRGRTALSPIIGQTFEQSRVTLGVFTLTSESLDAHVRLQAERVRRGEIAPEEIRVRMLQPARDLVMPYPRAKDDPDDPRPHARRRSITQRHTASLCQALLDLQTEGYVPSVEVAVREIPLTPTFKLYLLNESEALHGPYEVVERRILLEDGDEIDALDVVGLGAVLTHYVKDDDPESQDSLFVDSMLRWFDSCWTYLAV